ncbi:MAG: CHRD domain-containing protein [Luteolibacter sp.]
MKYKQQALRHSGQQILRNSMLVFLSTFTFAGAKVLDFDLSPTGSDDAVGLSPANEVPAVTSTGTGGAVSGGITFDTDTSILSFAMGYGSAAGFTDLSGAATGLHIHGPAAAGAEASVLFDLSTVNFPAVNPAKGGLIYGSLTLSPTQATNLLAGLNYVNIHTAANTDGEIRGQLIRANSAPDITGLADATVECGVLTTYSATVSDYDGDAVSAVWSVNGVPVETDTIAATGTPSNVVVTYKAKLPDGVNLLTLSAKDSDGNETIVDSIITVEDTIAPVITSASTNPKTLWPPNHKMVTVNVKAVVTDACGDTTWKIVSVKSSQPANGKGDGNTAVDFKILDDHSVSLRAERAGNDKAGRIYTITLRATDEAGNKSAFKTVTVTVPHDQGK